MVPQKPAMKPFADTNWLVTDLTAEERTRLAALG
jgi:hypothetical protein